MPRSAQKKNGRAPVKRDIVPMKQDIALTRPSFAQTFKEGLAFGAGSSIAQTMIRSIGSSAPAVEPKEAIESKEYKQCMIDFSDKAACAHLLQNA